MISWRSKWEGAIAAAVMRTASEAEPCEKGVGDAEKIRKAAERAVLRRFSGGTGKELLYKLRADSNTGGG